jgi:Cactus-binding C-terminus of cactin protein/Conserved mid region of cactin
LQKRAAYISTRFGYTAEENPFHDPNLHQAFTWNKKKEQQQQPAAGSKLKPGDGNAEQGEQKKGSGGGHHGNDGLKTLEEIEKLRQRRKDRELQQEEMERIRREESRMKELENFDEWAKKEEHFHVQQQRQRSAIRLVDGREKPIDVLAKNVLLFGLSEEEKKHRAGGRASVKYQEKYDFLKELENLEAELEEPQDFLKMLKLNELKQVLVDIDAFLTLERDAQSDYNNTNNATTDEGRSTILNYWQALRVVALDEIRFLETGGKDGSHAKMVQEIQKIFHQDNTSDGQSHDDAQLEQMRRDVAEKLRSSFSSNYNTINQDDGGVAAAVHDQKYWKDVQEQLEVHLAKRELSKLHSRMLVGQLERLEQKREQLAQAGSLKEKNVNDDDGDQKLPAVAAAGMAQEEAGGQVEGDEPQQPRLPDNVTQGFGDLEEELGLTDEIVTSPQQQQPAYAWADRYRPRKPRYFNRVKTGYDWNKYNKTHYDRDNPPPKTVQGYKFNIFYPDLIDPSAGTPQFKLEPADSDEFCIIRFHAGPPYEDVAFKIINREWNRSRKHGFKCTFERGVLSLYFNFKNFWYRR